MLDWRVFSIKDRPVVLRCWADRGIPKKGHQGGEVEWRRAWLRGAMGSNSTKGGRKGITPLLCGWNQRRKKPLVYRYEIK
ncbi:hypothetical protein MA16_Dca019313 [Dendrobium catenatum]|uniref:Uncharacterized protein n=1 Tax=Dendrobium catenatum TaxID=906689 RepID=A0A2I0WHY1_9ASPA|nr:hypothetical protein MA16_Dca019313 [Dendrobium catenatum]